MPDDAERAADEERARSRWMKVAEDAASLPSPKRPEDVAPSGPASAPQPISAEPQQPASAEPSHAPEPAHAEPASRGWLPKRPASSGEGAGWLPAESGSSVATAEPEQSKPGDSSEQHTSSWLIDQESPAGPYQPSQREAAAVDTYCAELCAPAAASAASAEVFESFTGGGHDDLLRVMRVVAARHMAVGGDGRRGWRRVLGGERARDCAATPELLAARANGDLSESERAEIDAHLSSCLRCQALELRSVRAERAFTGVVGTGVAAAAASELVNGDATALLERARKTSPEPPAEAADAPIEAPAEAPTPEPVPAAAEAAAPAAALAAADAAAPAAQEATPAADEAAAPPADETAPEAADGGKTSDWLPAEVGAAAGGAALGTAAAAEAEPAGAAAPRSRPLSPRARRRRLVPVVAAVAAVLALSAIAAVALTHGSSKNHPATSTPVAAAHTPAKSSTPVRHHTVAHAARPRKHATRAKHVSHAAAHTAVASAPASSAAAPVSSAPSTAAPAPTPAPAPSAPVSSSTPSSGSSGSSGGSSGGSSSASQPSVSIQQGSLGAANASQGLGGGK